MKNLSNLKGYETEIREFDGGKMEVLTDNGIKELERDLDLLPIAKEMGVIEQQILFKALGNTQLDATKTMKEDIYLSIQSEIAEIETRPINLINVGELKAYWKLKKRFDKDYEKESVE